MNTDSLTHTVRAKRYYYGCKPRYSVAFVGTSQQCTDYINRWNSRIYHLDHNEYSRWELKIMLTKNLSKHLAWELNKIR